MEKGKTWAHFPPVAPWLEKMLSNQLTRGLLKGLLMVFSSPNFL